MNLRVLTIPILLLFISCKSENTKQESINSPSLDRKTIKFNCADLGEDITGIPRSALYLSVDGKTVEVAKINNCLPLGAEQYVNYNIDANAVDAAFGYWAGSGSYYYVSVKGDEAYIYKSLVDESKAMPMDFSLFGIYKNGKFFEKDQKEYSNIAQKELLPNATPEIKKKATSKTIEDKIQPVVNQINVALPQLHVISKEIQFRFDDFMTPITVWYSKKNLPVKMEMGIKDDEGLFSNHFEYYFIDGKIWYSDQILSKYVFEDEKLQHYINMLWNDIEVSKARFKDWEKRILQTVAQIDNATINSRNDDDIAIIGNYELIQGSWQSKDDPKSLVVFKGTVKRDLYDDQTLSESSFSISSNCKNNSDTSVEEVTDAFLTLPKEDQCFYILRLDDKELQLNYIGRGNTLSYKRVSKIKN